LGPAEQCAPLTALLLKYFNKSASRRSPIGRAVYRDAISAADPALLCFIGVNLQFGALLSTPAEIDWQVKGQ